jgi:NO-binding membrane sensor protein with MHYT domain
VGVLLRLPLAIGWAVGLTGASYLATRVGKHTVDGRAAVVGAALLLAAELGFAAVTRDPRIRAERRLVVRRVLTSGALVAGALLVDFLLLGAAAFSASSSVVLAAAGVAAAVAAIGVVLRLLRV